MAEKCFTELQSLVQPHIEKDGRIIDANVDVDVDIGIGIVIDVYTHAVY